MEIAGINDVEARIRAIEQQTAAFATPSTTAPDATAPAQGAEFASLLSDAMNVSASGDTSATNPASTPGASGGIGGTSELSSLLNGLGGSGSSPSDALSLLSQFGGTPTGTPHSTSDIASLLSSLQPPKRGSAFDAAG